MQPEYETHNLGDNHEPRRYEAVYLLEGKIIVKISVYQHAQKLGTGKSVMKWDALAAAWVPGQGAMRKDGSAGNEILLCSLERPEIVAREVVPTEATEDTWLEAVRHDAGTLLDRAKVYTGVLAAGTDQKRRSRLAA